MRKLAPAALATLVLAGSITDRMAEAQTPIRPETNPGQVQKRIPQPGQVIRPLPQLRVPAPVLAPSAPAVPLSFVLTGVVIDGAKAIKVAALAPAYEDYLARKIGAADIETILDRITDRYRRAGYFLSRAVAPPQPLRLGILHVTVIEGYVRRVVFPGLDPARKARLSSYFTAVLDQRPLTLARLERALLIVNDIPGLHIDPKLKPVQGQPAAFDLVVHVKRRRLSGFASLDNLGTESLGPWQAQLSGGINSAITAFDRLQVSVFDTLNHPSELLSTELFYNTPIDHAGTRLMLSVARTHLLPGGRLAPLDVRATAMRYAARMIYPLLRGRERSLWLGGGFDVLDSTEESAGVPLFDDHLRVLRASVNYVGNDAAGNSNLAAFQFSQGLGFLGASRAGSSDLSRSNGRSDFTKFEGRLTREQVLAAHWGAQFAVAGQKSLQPLLISEQFALGGATFGRGYDPAEIAGDDALAGSVELRYGRLLTNLIVRSYQLYGFYDIGRIWNIDPESTTPRSQSLASLGAGLRLALQHHINASIEIAKPLTRIVAAENGKPLRVFITLSAAF